MKLQSLASIIITSRFILTTAKSIRGSAPSNTNGNIESIDDTTTNNVNDERDLQGPDAVSRPHHLFPQGVDPEFRHLQDLEGTTSQLEKDSRIIGGSSASNGEFKYSISMQDTQGHFCGGSLITPNLVLTAAHCLGGSYDVIVGRTKNINGSGGQSIPKKQEIRHPKYNSQKTDDDFAILVLNEAVDMSDNNVGLVKLNTQSSYPSVGSKVTVIGWGETQARGLSNDLLKVEVEVISNQECDSSSGSVGGYSDNYNGQISDSMMCANVDGGGKDACQGDSGGPCVVETNGQHTQVGVVSWGIGCASAAFPGVYSRISEAFDWIDDTVCENSVNPIPPEFSCGNNGGGNQNPTPPPAPNNPPPTPQPVSTGNNESPSFNNPNWRTVLTDDFTQTRNKGGHFTSGGKDARFYSEAKGVKGVVRLQRGAGNAKKASVSTDPITVRSYSKCRAIVDFMLLGMKRSDEWCVEYSDGRGNGDNYSTAKCFKAAEKFGEGFHNKRWWKDEEAEFSVKNMDEVTLRLRCNSSSRKRDVLISEVKLQCN